MTFLRIVILLYLLFEHVLFRKTGPHFCGTCSGGRCRAGRLRLTVACGDYEIVRALKEGAVEADGIELVMLTGMGPRERHWRMARKAEFDVCKANAGAYFMERAHGAALTAIPVFLHRRFRLFVNAAA